MVQAMVAPTGTTLTLAAPQLTSAARAVGWSLLRIRPTTRVTSMIGLAGSRADQQALHVGAGGRQHQQGEGDEARSHLPCVGTGREAL
jgi:hypothetical protein